MSASASERIHFLNFHKRIEVPPAPGTGMIVVVPARDEPDIGKLWDSLNSAAKPDVPVEVIVVVNNSENDHVEIRESNRRIYQWLKVESGKTEPGGIALLPLYYDSLGGRKPGAGLARRIGMDEAARRLFLARNPQGIIISLDADCTVEANYFNAIRRKFRESECGVAVVRFEHPLYGSDFPPEVYLGIIQYELHMRYFVRALAFTGYPWPFHTVGSAFAVTAEAYARQGGMNLKQGGEDFYFLHKMFKSEKTAVISDTCVHPSPRPSDRVPFGTGPEIKRFLENEDGIYQTYNLDAFEDLKLVFRGAMDCFDTSPEVRKRLYPGFPESFRRFLSASEFSGRMEEILNNAATPESFRKRFFRWFDAFRIIKFLNYTHQTGYFLKSPVHREAGRLMERLGEKPPGDIFDTLAWYRKSEATVA